MGIIHYEKECLGYGEREILQDVSLDIEEGEFVLVCGPTGGGKSTLLSDMKKRLGMRAAFAMQNPDISLVCDRVDAELRFNLLCKGETNNLVRRRVAECAGYFGISRLLKESVSNLSGGEKQIVNLASAMTANPSVLILDEPTAMLDPIMTDRILDMVMKLNREYGITVVMSEHKPESLFEKADKVIFVEGGTVLVRNRDEMAGKLLEQEDTRGYLPAAARMLAAYSTQIPYTVAAGRRIVSGLNDSVKQALTDAYVGQPKRHPGSQTVLEVNHVSFAYEKNKRILEDVNLTVNEGEIISILGENGCGKSTLAKIICGVLPPYNGSVIINGKKVKGAGDGVGMLCQDVSLHFTKDLYDEWDEFRGRHPYDLSGGEKQKLALRLVLKKNPQVLVLDEPTKGLDPNEKKAFMKKIKELADNHMAILIITHDVELAKEGDRMLLMHGGEIAFFEESKSFCENNIFYTTPAVKILRNNG